MGGCLAGWVAVTAISVVASGHAWQDMLRRDKTEGLSLSNVRISLWSYRALDSNWSPLVLCLWRLLPVM